ncbi:MAG: hypothetical protein J5I93_29510 [Pirellulaceae bacterium]|nr:hypothetical protein [Pirellulaceae bacterium]
MNFVERQPARYQIPCGFYPLGTSGRNRFQGPAGRSNLRAYQTRRASC